MAQYDNPDKKRSPQQALRDFRRFVKNYHPDLGNAQPTPKDSNEIPVLRALTEIHDNPDKTKNLAGWPSDYKKGMRVLFPDISENVKSRAIPLTSTPEEFFDLLDYIDRNKKFPERDFPEVSIVRLSKPGDEEKPERTAEDDPTLQALIAMTNGAESIDDLIQSFQLHTLFLGPYLTEVGLPKMIDDRAYFLFQREAYKAQSIDELDAVKNKIDAFTFYTTEGSAHVENMIATRRQEIESTKDAVKPARKELPKEITEEQKQKMIEDRQVRQIFIERVKNASSNEELEKLDAEATERNFFNRGELGLVRAAITKKRRKLA